MFSVLGIVLDIAIVLTLVIVGIIGYKKGFLKSLLGLFSWIVCIAVSVFLAKYVAGWINGIHNFSGDIASKVSKSLTEQHEFFSKAVSSYETNKAMVDDLSSININGFLKAVLKVVLTNIKIDPASTETIGEVAGASVGQICMVIISAILLFIVLKIVVAILTKLFDKISQTRVLGTLNKILGLVFGLVKAALIIVVVNVAFVALSMVPAVNKTFGPMIQNDTKIEKVVYNKTDEVFEKYVIDGNLIQKWVEDLWNAR